MKLLIDMNLSPLWVAVFEKKGWKQSIGLMSVTLERQTAKS